jgi:hypothetical protein
MTPSISHSRHQALPVGFDRVRERRLRSALRLRLGLGLGLGVALGLAACASDVPTLDDLFVSDGVIRAARVSIAGPELGPDAEVFASAPVTTVTLLAQTITTPQNPAPAVTAVDVRAVHDGQWLSLHFEWADRTRSDTLDFDAFGDQLAVQVPLDPNDPVFPSPFMGDVERPVVIIQWRAAMQRLHGLDQPPDLRDLHPRTYTDGYLADLLPPEAAAAYTGAMAVDNPLAQYGEAAEPVLAHVAAGFGSLTAVPGAGARGWAEHGDRGWRLVMHIPIAGDDRPALALAPGADTVLAFAVWEGGGREVGSRKAWANWTPIRVAP